MLKWLLKCCTLLLLSSCGSLMHPGIISMPHLKQKGDVQMAAQYMGQEQGDEGAFGHMAYAWSDEWGVVLAGGYMTNARRIEPNSRKTAGCYEVGIIRQLGAERANPFTTNSLQFGFGQNYGRMAFYNDPMWTYSQNQLYLQGNSRHNFTEDLAVSFGLRLGANAMFWAAVSDNPSPIQRDLQPFAMSATTMVQIERFYGPFSLSFIFQPTYRLSQREVMVPTNPFNLGVRWNLK